MENITINGKKYTIDVNSAVALGVLVPVATKRLVSFQEDVQIGDLVKWANKPCGFNVFVKVIEVTTGQIRGDIFCSDISDYPVGGKISLADQDEDIYIFKNGKWINTIEE